jgi:type I restriction-modification system DNA methylase subunit
MKNYEIGQIIFLLSNDDMRLCPVRVIEETLIKSMKGETKRYVVEYEDQEGKGTLLNLPSKNYVEFSSLDEARNYMIVNATSAIDKICESAEKWKNEVFDINESEEVVVQNEEVKEFENQKVEKNNQKSDVQNIETVLLDNGMVAKVHMPFIGEQ